MKLIYLIFIVALFFSDYAGAQDIVLATPSEKQIRFADWEVGAFFHYTLNPFTGQEHGDGQEPPSKFNPTELDVDQWITTAKAMGAKYAVLTARHEGGFCLWPSKTTDYTIANSPYKNGKGDLVREFVDACRRHGLKVGLYHTATFDANAVLGSDYTNWGTQKLPLEWNSPEWGKAFNEAYERFPGLKERIFKKQLAQMTELLTQYGQIDFMWSDHWNAIEPNGLWRAITDLVEELQPNMVFMGPETWVPGNETGHVVYPMWNAVNTIDGTKYSRPATNKGDVTTTNNYGLLEGEVRTGHPLGKFWRVRECTTNSAFHYGGWFWHPDSVKKTHPKKHWEHLDLYYRTVGLGANTIINLPPDDRGLIPDDIVAAAKKLGHAIRERFSNPIAETEGVQKGKVVELNWAIPQEINTVVTMENIVNGQKVIKYTLEAFIDGEWQKIEPQNRLNAFTPYNNNPGYQTIGHKKIDRIEPVVTNKIRFRCLEAVVEDVEIRKLQVYNNPPIPRTFDAGYPYLSGVETEKESAHRGIKRDVNYIGNPITLDGKKYKYGLLICPVEKDKKGYVVFDMRKYPKAKGIEGRIGIEDLRGGKGTCTFIVEVMKNGQWTELYRSKHFSAEVKSDDVRVVFPGGTEKLRLTVTDGGDNHWNDHAVWADGKFFE